MDFALSFECFCFSVSSSKSTVVGNMKMQIVGLSSGRFGSVSEDRRLTADASKCLLEV